MNIVALDARATPAARPRDLYLGWRIESLGAAVAVLTLIVLASAVLLVWKFDGLYGQDPYAYFDYGTGVLRRTIEHGAGLSAMSWPLGYPIPVALASLVAGPHPAAAQAVSLVSGVGCVALTYFLGRDLLTWSGLDRGRAGRAAAAGALLLAATGWMLQASVMVMPDGLACFSAVLSAWALVRWCRDEPAGRVWPVLAGAGLGWAAISRWGQLVLVPVWMLALLPLTRTDARRIVRTVPWALAPFVLIVGGQIALALVVPAQADLGRWPFLGDLGLVNGTGSSWSPLHLFARHFTNADGYQHYALPNVVYYFVAPFLPKNLTPLTVPFAALGIWSVVTRLRPAFALLLGWPAGLLLLDAGLAEQNIRFVLPALPPLALLAGLGFVAVADRVPDTLRILVPAALAATVIAMATVGLVDMRKVVDASAVDRQTAHWAAAVTGPSTTVVSFEITATLQHSSNSRARDLSGTSPVAVRRLAAKGATYLLVRVPDLLGQWAGRPPGRIYAALLRSPGLVSLGTDHGYTLFRVRRT